jgi:hypothetical protein
VLEPQIISLVLIFAFSLQTLADVILLLLLLKVKHDVPDTEENKLSI